MKLNETSVLYIQRKDKPTFKVNIIPLKRRSYETFLMQEMKEEHYLAFEDISTELHNLLKEQKTIFFDLGIKFCSNETNKMNFLTKILTKTFNCLYLICIPIYKGFFF